MNPSTASGRLVKDILFSFVQKEEYMCHHCGEPMSREDFSIEHIRPWLDSKDPVGLYFDLDNISFSHLKCNIGASRQPTTKHPSIRSYAYGCRCDECRELKKLDQRKTRKKKKNWGVAQPVEHHTDIMKDVGSNPTLSTKSKKG